MNSNPAWQGAAQVASTRLQTIDQALAKLEAAIPDDLSSGPDQPATIDNSGDTPSSGNDKPNPLEAEINQKEAIQPSSIPSSSLKALESFLAGAA